MSEASRVLIADSLSPKAAEVLSASSAVSCDERAGISADELLSVIGDYQGLLVRSRTKVTADVVARAENLKVVGRAGIGVDNIDIAACSKRGILVENAPTGNSVTTAEHAICMMAALARQIPQATASMKANKWEKKALAGGVELFDKTLGIVGLGNIGKIVADRAKGLRMRVIASDPVADAAQAKELGVELVPFDALLAQADFISIHAPLLDSTRGLFNADAFAKAKDGLRLVHCARGGIVDEGALVDALNSGKVLGAAVDVFEKEPPPEDHPLILHPNVISTPHLGASTNEAQVKVAVEIAEQMVAYFESGTVKNALNADAVK